jgi:hypothetical protein
VKANNPRSPRPAPPSRQPRRPTPVGRSISPALKPNAFLVRVDDIENPMHKASQALEFARQFLDLMLLTDGYEVYPPTLEFASVALTDARRRLDAAVRRVRSVSSDLLVADPTDRSPDEIRAATKARLIAEALGVQR